MKRDEIGIGSPPDLPFVGADLWTAYEVSWLNVKGKPQVAVGKSVVPAESTHIIESKSFKLYLNSFNNTRLPEKEDPKDPNGVQALLARLRKDLSAGIWQGQVIQSQIEVELVLPHEFAKETVQELEGINLDELDIECTQYQPDPTLLQADFDQAPVTQSLTSNLLKSNCLVTGHPDWGSVCITYTGPPINQAGLLRYIVSFRNHNEFHEQCVERIFMDITCQCKPIKLTVYARYTRRGGLDINPWRTSRPRDEETSGVPPPNVRNVRQ